MCMCIVYNDVCYCTVRRQYIINKAQLAIHNKLRSTAATHLPGILDDLVDNGEERILNDGHSQPQHSPLHSYTGHQVSVVFLGATRLGREREMGGGGGESEYHNDTHAVGGGHT